MSESLSKDMLDQIGIKDLGEGFYEVKGHKLSLADILGVANKTVKSEQELVDRGIQQEYSRAKSKHYAMEYARIIENDSDLMSLVGKFDKSPESYRDLVVAKVKRSF